MASATPAPLSLAARSATRVPLAIGALGPTLEEERPDPYVSEVSGRRAVCEEKSVVAEQIQSFRTMRVEEAKREFHVMISMGITLAISSLIAVSVTAVCNILLPHPGWYAGYSLGVCCLSASVVIMSMCPPDQYNLDQLLKSRPLLRIGLGMCFLAVHLYIGILHPPHVLFAAAVPALKLALGELCGPVRPSSCLVWILLLNMLGWVATWDILGLANPNPDGEGGFHQIIRLVGAVLILSHWLWRRRVQHVTGRQWCSASTAATVDGMHAWFFFTGCTDMAGAVVRLSTGRISAFVAAMRFLWAVNLALPPLMVALLGRERVFHFAARRFDRNPDRARRDGAFMAELLDSTCIAIGQTWWVLRGQDDVAPPGTTGVAGSLAVDVDHQCLWQRGHIVDIGVLDFGVAVLRAHRDLGGHAPAVGRTSSLQAPRIVRASTTLRPHIVRASTTLKAWLTQTVIVRSATTLRMSKLLSNRSASGPLPRSRESAPSEFPFEVAQSSSSGREVEVIRVSLARRSTPCDELLSLAQRSLRCVDWCKMTPELLVRDGSIAFGASRPVAEREVIDLFMSHSWYDDASAKRHVLSGVAAEFAQRHNGREPTFWLDKACIDQLNIADGLRVLPVNVMACKGMLVLCGRTYTKRLWCVWELFVLLAFARFEHVLERLRVIPLDEDGGGAESSALHSLQRFDVASASCFDPNEEARLQSIVASLGTSHFNKQIRSLGSSSLRGLTAPGTQASRPVLPARLHAGVFCGQEPSSLGERSTTSQPMSASAGQESSSLAESVDDGDASLGEMVDFDDDAWAFSARSIVMQERSRSFANADAPIDAERNRQLPRERLADGVSV